MISGALRCGASFRKAQIKLRWPGSEGPMATISGFPAIGSEAGAVPMTRHGWEGTGR